jgi:hypothetical protein
MREMIEAARMVVMAVSKDHRFDIARRIDAHGVQPRSDLFRRCNLDLNLLEERMPAGEIARYRVAPGVARIDQEVALRMLDQECQDRQRAEPLRVTKNVNLAADGAAPFTSGHLRRFQAGFACFYRGYADHPRGSSLVV